MRTPSFAVGLAVLAMGCGAEFTPEYRLEKSRVLALQAEPPQPSFGTSTTLRSLFYLHEYDKVMDTVVSYHWSWCPLPTQSGDGYQCPVDQAGFEQLLSGLMAGQSAPSLDLGTGETATFTNVFPAATLAAICNANAGVTLAAGEVDAGVADAAGVPGEMADGGVAADDAGSAPEDGGADAESMAANWSAPMEIFDAGASGGIPMNKIFSCGSAGFPVTVRLDFLTANMELQGKKPASAVFKVYLPIDDTLPGNQNPVPGIVKWALADALDTSSAEPLDQLGSVILDRNLKYKLVVDMPESNAEKFYGWTRVTPAEAKQTNQAAGGYNVDPITKGHVLGDAQEILSLNWYVEGGGLGDNGGERGGNTGFNPYAEAPPPYEKALEDPWKPPALADYKAPQAKIYVLVRDDRGGVGWTSAAVTLVPEPQ